MPGPGDPAAPGAPNPDGAEAIRAAQRLIAARQHRRAVETLERAQAADPGNVAVRRMLALAYGGWAEHTLERTGPFGVAPAGPLLDLLEATLRSAIAADPGVPDPHWDLAVLAVNARGDHAAGAAHLQRAKQAGMRHPRMAELEQRIAARAPALPGPDPAAPDVALRLLLLAFLHDPRVVRGALLRPPGAEVYDPRDRAFDGACREAVAIARRGLDAAGLARVLAAARPLRGDEADFASDLLRFVAREVGPQAEEAVVAWHLRGLIEFGLAAGASGDPEQLRKARQAVRRARRVLAWTQQPVHPQLRGLLEVVQAQACSRAGPDQDLAAAMRHYLAALDLFEPAGDVGHAATTRDVLGRMAGHLAQQTGNPLRALGERYRDAELAWQAAQRLGDVPLMVRAGLAFSGVAREARQPAEAEAAARAVLARPGLPDAARREATLELSCALNEQRKAAEAAPLQEQLLARDAAAFAPGVRAGLWTTLGNSRRLLGDRAGARQAFAAAEQELRGMGPDVEPIRAAHLAGLLAELDFLDGDPAAGHARLAAAAATLSGADRGVQEWLNAVEHLHFHSLAARCYHRAGMDREVPGHLEPARRLLRAAIARAPNPAVWESMLQEWADIDGLEVQHRLRAGDPAAALRVAEGAKGRLLAFLQRVRWQAPDQAAAAVLDAARQDRAVSTVQAWVDGGPGRTVVALFAAAEGLALFRLAPGGAVQGHWVADLAYDAYRTAVHDPWEAAVAAAMGGDAAAWPEANGRTDRILEQLGAVLGQAFPALAQPGRELVLVPHRLFRALPLGHAVLPTGRRLSEVHERVTTAPSLADLAAAVEDPAPAPLPGAVAAFADAEPARPLPFARLEALALGGDSAKLGPAVEADAVAAALAEEGGAVVVSCHGAFDAGNPWQSLVQCADRPLRLHETLTRLRPRAGWVLLGVCEAGRSRRSASDEPLGFPALLHQAGARCVVGPLWPVDDFASFVLVTRLGQLLRKGLSPAEGLAGAAAWLREAPVAEVEVHLGAVRRDLEALGPAAAEALAAAEPAWRRREDWLRSLPPGSRPFAAPLMWAAFQVTGRP